MGLDYAIHSSIKKEELIPCLKWLSVNTDIHPDRDCKLILNGKKY